MQNQDVKITKWMNKIENIDENSPFMSKLLDTHDDVSTSFTPNGILKSHTVKDIPIFTDGKRNADQLEEFIEGVIKDKFDESTKPFQIYTKPYTIRINGLRMLDSYQPLKF